MVSRVYVEKKSGFDIDAQQLKQELCSMLSLDIEELRLFNRYDVEGIDKALMAASVSTVFSEPQTDTASEELPDLSDYQVFAVEFLPGQFDQRADSASECIQLTSQATRPLVRSAVVYAIKGVFSQENLEAIKRYVINPVEAREAALELPETLQFDLVEPGPVEVIEGFIGLNEQELQVFIAERGLAMDIADALVFQSYFQQEGRNPTITELKVVDTYWSDHCRHTTFGTCLEDLSFDDPQVEEAFNHYRALRHELGRDEKDLCLMDMATIGARYLKAQGKLDRLDESEEVNACTVKVSVDVNGTPEDWLFLFKNETHNHPTEIEPFGGAATCVGGAIRDPLSGRSYVYQAMRVSGAANPLTPLSETLPGKLAQRRIVTEAAAGYSSYGNQIGLATGQVCELYHPSYVAKRMEIGAVLGAAPASHVRRETPSEGDKVILLGGRTGRDGIGGATGSSKAQKVQSVEECGAEVQKGNAPVERKLQRLFRRGEACRLIKRCNDFGAGGVCVSIGELCDGIDINLDAIPKKYEGLDGTELAIAESQERMAVALAAADVDEFLGYAREENLEAVVVADVTAEPRMRMRWRGDLIVDLSREFLASNGAAKHQKVHVCAGEPFRLPKEWQSGSLSQRLSALLTDLNVASHKGLSERFDSTIGAATVLMPFGGRKQLTPIQAMVAKFPVLGETTTVSGMAWGFNPAIMEKNQFVGAYLSVVESVARLIATGFCRKDTYLSLQEYFEKLRQDSKRWGRPVAAVLGALRAQLDLEVAAIGGKDSMSGSFEELDVVPTLVSFAVATGHVERIVSPEFKAVSSRVVSLAPHYCEDGLRPQADSLNACMQLLEDLIGEGKVRAAATPGYGCRAEALFKMGVGNGFGLNFADGVRLDDLFMPAYGSFIVELDEGAPLPEASELVEVREFAQITEDYSWVCGGETVSLEALQEMWEDVFAPIFPYREHGASLEQISWTEEAPMVLSKKLARPRVVIPVFPGTNCEYDSKRAFERAGAEAEIIVINNLTPQAIAESVHHLAAEINKAHIVMLPGGFSGGDEPDGSAKFITAFFRAPAICEAVRELLHNRDGLMLGICNGFQALVKLGLVPFGDIRPMDPTCPTLTFNEIGRHQSSLVRTRVASSLSPWLSCCSVGDVHTVAISHGEGRFVCSEPMLAMLKSRGQIATQYVDEAGMPSMDLSVNPNGSLLAIESITSPDGRILGKMGHTERSGDGLYKNVPGDTYQPLFEGGVNYFTE